MKVTRSILTTTVKFAGEDEAKAFPGMSENEVRNACKIMGKTIEEIRSGLVRYGCSQEEFLTIAKPM